MRKDVLNVKGYKIMDQVDMSTNQTSQIVYIPFLDNVGMSVFWDGTSPVGELTIEASNQQENPNEAMVWTSLDFGTPITIGGNTGSHLINMTAVPYNAIRIQYAATSGTGALTVIIQAKMV